MRARRSHGNLLAGIESIARLVRADVEEWSGQIGQSVPSRCQRVVSKRVSQHSDWSSRTLHLSVGASEAKVLNLNCTLNCLSLPPLPTIILDNVPQDMHLLDRRHARHAHLLIPIRSSII